MNDQTLSRSISDTLPNGDPETGNPMNLTCTAQIPTLNDRGESVLVEYVIVMADVDNGAAPPIAPQGATVFVPPAGSASAVFELNGDGPDGGKVKNKKLAQAGILVYSTPTA